LRESWRELRPRGLAVCAANGSLDEWWRAIRIANVNVD
jgi:hypothetical protein